MKIQKRLWALVLCLAMVVSLMPVYGVKAEENGVAEEIVEDVTETESQPESEPGSETSEYSYTWEYYDEGSKEWLELPENNNQEWLEHIDCKKRCKVKKNDSTSLPQTMDVEKDENESKEASCTQPGYITYFADFPSNFGGVKKKRIDLPMTPHEFGNATYKWEYFDSNDNIWIQLDLQDNDKWITYDDNQKQCIASHACNICKHEEVIETVQASLTKNIEATCVDTGIKEYTAAFNSSLCSIQTHTVDFPTNSNHKMSLVSEDEKKPTCEDAGHIKGWTCNACSKHFSDENGRNEITDGWVINALGHDWNDWVVISSPDPTKSGMLSKQCKRDSKHKEEFTLPSLNKEYYYYTENSPTCTAKGTGTYTYKYKDKIDNQTVSFVVEIDPTGHYWNSWIIEKAPTCTQEGQRKHSCKNCPIVEYENLPALGHNYGDGPDWVWTPNKNGNYQAKAIFTCKREGCGEGEDGHTKEINAEDETETIIVAPGCESTGTSKYTASVTFNNITYSDTKKEVITPATGHSYGEPTWNWIKQDDGDYKAEAVFVCGQCPEPTHNHSVSIPATTVTSTILKKAECTTNGEIKYTATIRFNERNYEGTKTESLDPTGHSYGDPDWNWEITDEGYQVTATFTCSKCTEEIKDHSIIKEAEVESNTTVAPTCLADGEIVYTAKLTLGDKNHETQQTEPIPKTGHSYGKPDWKWVKKDKSYTVEAIFTCTKCTEEEELEGHEKVETAEVKYKKEDATCTNEGKETYIASVVFGLEDYSNTKELKIPVKSHKLTKTSAKDATCTELGNVEYYTCNTCKKHFSDAEGKKEIEDGRRIIPAKGHHIVEKTVKKRTAKKEGLLTQSCDVCKTVIKETVLPSTTKTIVLGKSVKLISNPVGCTFKLANEKKYSKYFKLDKKTGKITTKKNSKVYKNVSKSIPVNVTVGGKSYKVKVKLEIPAPTIKKITRTKEGIYFKYTFKYNVPNATKIKVRTNVKGINNAGLDRYLSKPQSDEESYVSINLGDMKEVKFKIVAYYGKNVSKTRVITK